MADKIDDCIFCKIASGELGTPFLAETEHVVAFEDISPQAPTHVLVIPKRHVESIRDLGEDDAALAGEMMTVANRVAKDKGVDESGYRLVTNAGRDSGQEVFHLHFHVLGGRKLGPIA